MKDVATPRPRMLGPVEKLEDHVRADWWENIFNSTYLKTDGDVVEDASITCSEVDFVVNILDLKPEHEVLDLCCGQGRHVIELTTRGYTNVEGLDRSRYLVQKARARAKKNALSVKFREGDARRLPYRPDTFDVVLILGNSFGYFETVQDDLAVLRGVCRVLKPWGRLLIDLANGDYVRTHFAPRSWEWIDSRHFVCRERSLSVDGQRLITREIITDTQKGLLADQFYAERLYAKESLTRLLQDAGLSDITSHGEIRTASQRNQDLGMMEQRVMVSAMARKDWSSSANVRKPSLKRVTVVLGDPTKRDPLKPSEVFDDDDYYTIDQMKAALKSLGAYTVRYIDSHDRLIDELRRLRGKGDLVFNLCDEGFANDPRKELHVPALLDQLGIPYTGGGPQCLAYCYDKSLVRGVAKEMGIPVPEALFVDAEDTTFDLPFDFPVIVKPNFGDSSFGIMQTSVAHDCELLLNAISNVRQRFGYEKPLVAEEFLSGKDLTVGLIGNPDTDYQVLPIIEEDYSLLPPELPRICGYEAKWDPESPYWNALKSVRADLDPDTESRIVDGCMKLFQRLECRDYARFDWRLDDRGEPRLLEVNPNPGWCWDGHLAKMCKMDGISYADMLRMILDAAERRYAAT